MGIVVRVFTLFIMFTKRLVSHGLPAALVAAIVAIVGYANWRDAQQPARDVTPRPMLGAESGARTSREDLARRIADMDARLAAQPEDSGAAVLLAEALIRQARVASNSGLVMRAESVLKRVLRDNPASYDAQRMLATVYLSQHRFREGIAAAETARDMRPDDPWNDGIIGDGHLELGEYPEAFAAFQAMMDKRPSAAAYARAAYAQELQGNLEAAIDNMARALMATSPHDLEAKAWHYAQLGELSFSLGRLDEARRAFERADVVFPGHPFAIAGRVKVLTARSEYNAALEIALGQFAKTPTPDVAARIGDLYRRAGDDQAAERYYVLAETGWRTDTPEPVYLSAFLAERDRHTDEALRLAEQEWTKRHDVFTADALAWASFKTGQLDRALEASQQALRTGTRHRQILYHAAAIHEATGDRSRARELVRRSLDGHPDFDPIVAPQARALLMRLNGETHLAKK